MTRNSKSVALVAVDKVVCAQVAAVIRGLHVPAAEEDVSLKDWPRELAGNLFLAVVAICHQTSPMNLPRLAGTINGKTLWGWDYLFTKFTIAAKSDPSILMPDRWVDVRAEEIEHLFVDKQLGSRLSDTVGRSKLLRDLGAKFRVHNWRFADEIYAESNRTISDAHHGLLTLLAEIQAYSDPVRKKSLFFLTLMQNSGLWTYADPENLGPPVDYHEVRGHLRIGTVRITDKTLSQKIQLGHPVSVVEDEAIRARVYEAIMWISGESGLKDPSRLHYLFWHIFRSLCVRQNPFCYTANLAKLPTRYSQDIRNNVCPFSAACSSAGQERPITEHVLETEHY